MPCRTGQDPTGFMHAHNIFQDILQDALQDFAIL